MPDLLACCRYIELNPVRARMVADAADYPWSSYRARVGEMPDGNWLDADPCFVALGNTAMEQRHQYEVFIRQAIPTDEIRLIRDALQRGAVDWYEPFCGRGGADCWSTDRVARAGTAKD